MPYRAGAGSSPFGGYATPPQRPMIDLAGAIDAASSGASTLIRQAIERKHREAELTLQQQREGREAAAQQAELAFRQKEADDRGTERAQDFGLRQTAERHRFIEAGGIPSHAETVAQPAGTAAVTPFQPTQPTASPIAQAMGGAAGGAMGGLPGVQITPSNAPASTGPGDRVNANPAPAAVAGSLPINRPVNVETPESYDPTKSGAFERAIETQRLRNAGFVTRDEARNEFQSEQQQRRLAAQQAGREYMAGAAQSLARLRSGLAANKSGVAKAMTGNQMETARQNAASGLLEQTNGSYDDAETLLNSTDGKAFRDLGVEPRHLMFARSKYVDKVARSADAQTKGLFGVSPDSAVARAKQTRQMVKETPPAPSTTPNANDTPRDINLGATTGAKPQKLIAPAAKAPAAKAPAAPTGQKPEITKDQAEFLRVKKGMSDADIQTRYTVKP